MSHLTAAEVLETCKSKMGVELGITFHFCRQHLFDLSSVWDQHETLFQNKERVEVLNKTGGLLSFNIQRLFYRYVLLGMMRLLDPEKTMGRKNLVLELLLRLANEKCRTPAEKIFSEIKNKTNELSAVRNKILAHNDYDVATKQQADLNIGSRLLITNSLRSILGRVLN
jgi:AbiU2